MQALVRCTQPIIVCGLPRSGTTLISELLNSDPHIAIYDEFVDVLILKLRDLTSACRGLLSDPWQAWRNVTAPDFEQRLADMTHSAFRVLSRRRILSKRRVDRFGFKLPLAENRIAELDEIFGPSAAVFVYCLTDPSVNLESWARMPWALQSVEYFATTLSSSLDAILQLKERCPNRVCIIPTKAISDDVALRHNVIRFLFDVLDRSIPRNVIEFASAWPKVNTRDYAYRYYGTLPKVDQEHLDSWHAELTKRLAEDALLSERWRRANEIAMSY